MITILFVRRDKRITGLIHYKWIGGTGFQSIFEMFWTRIYAIPFDRGQTTLHRAIADELVKAFDRPGAPTTILVVAGYADTGGRADLNLRVSQERAENVSRIIKEQAKLLNATQTIGMGGTELLDSKRPDQNRAVEIWAVVPL